MSVTKRVRFEILRRDEHTCQYCGQMAPDVTLHIDHVIPVALGGSDDPGNLVTACRDCNAGKASISPDSPIVQRVADHAAAYAAGMLDKMTRMRADVEQRTSWVEDFKSIWTRWRIVSSGAEIELPSDWSNAVVRFYGMGIPREVIVEAVEIAMGKRGLYGDYPEFAYMCGIIWRRVDDRQIDYSLTTETAAAWTDKDMQEREHAAFNRGYQAGRHRTLASHHPADDVLVRFIDGRGQHAA